MDGTLFTGDQDGNVYAIDITSGEKHVLFRLGDRTVSSPTVVNGVLYIGCDDGNVYALDIETKASSDDSRVLLGTLGHHKNRVTTDPARISSHPHNSPNQRDPGKPSDEDTDSPVDSTYLSSDHTTVAIETGDTSREPDLAAVSSPPRRALTDDEIEAGEPIGSGGQGIVHQAKILDDCPPNQVALKEPQQQNRTLNKSVVESFLEEAETWEMLDNQERQKPRWNTSEHIVGIVDTGDQLPWIAMEYMDGGSLGDRLADHPDGFPIDEALWIGECICRGVELAHNNGIAHLDIKPENILFRETKDRKWDVPKLADWGGSRKLAEQTGTMEALSVEYAAPEQFEQQKFGDPDMLTDIYQVGVLLYTVFTGEPPHTGSQLAVRCAVVNDTKPKAPSDCRSELPAELDRIVLKAMAQKKSERYRTISILVNELQSLRTGDGVTKRSEKSEPESG
nr:protein kinase [Halorubrum sp. GN11_10-6_MGM]